MKNKIVTIIGGSGFIGSQIAKNLLEDGYLVQIVSRDPHKNQEVKTAAEPGRIFFKQGNVNNIDEIEKIISTSETVINMVGVLFEKGSQNFFALHTDFPSKIAKICKKLGIPNLIHFSALGADKAICSHYAKSKYNGEKKLLEIFPEAIIFRPSVVFGTNDNFINKFRNLVKYLPIFPLIRDGSTKFQPVYVGDISKAVDKILENPHKFKGKIIELAGLQKYSLKQILEIIKTLTKSNCILLEMPERLNYYTGLVAELFPKPILTRDQVVLSRYDNVISNHSKNLNFKDLAISPVDFYKTVAQYVK